jgi:hypothetical protein
MVPASKPNRIQTRHIQAITVAGRHTEARLFGGRLPTQAVSTISEPVHLDNDALSVRHATQSILDYECVQIVGKCHDRDRTRAAVGPWSAHSES